MDEQGPINIAHADVMKPNHRHDTSVVAAAEEKNTVPNKVFTHNSQYSITVSMQKRSNDIQ